MRLFRYKFDNIIYLDFWFNERRWMYLNTLGNTVNGNQGVDNDYLKDAEEIFL